MEDIEKLINSLGDSVRDVVVKQNPDSGNVQISFTSYGQNVNMVYNPNDPSSLDRFFEVGRGTFDGYSPDGHFDLDLTKTAFETDKYADFTTITVAGTSTDSRIKVDSTCNQVMSMLKKYYDDPFAVQESGSKTQTYNASIVGGASANGQNTVYTVQEFMNSMKTDSNGNKQPIHIMLFDDAYADSNGPKEKCEMFTKTLLNNKEVVEYMKDSNSVVFAYPQAASGQKVLYNQAAGQLSKVNDEGIAVVMCFNDKNYSHSTITPSYEERMAQSIKYNISPEDEGRLGEQLRIMTMDFSKTGNDYLDNNEYQFFDENGHLHDLPAERINEYVDAFYNDRLGEFIEKLDNNEAYELTSHDLLTGQVKVVYSSVISNLGGIINLINNTNFSESNTRVNGANSTASLFDNLSSSNNYLFGLSSNLLNGISNDVNNIEQMLTNWAKTDADLANLASTLNNGDLNASLVGDSFAMDSMHFSEITSSFSSIFSGRVTEGSVGKISMSDIGSVFNGSGLTGSLGNLLDTEISDARNLQNSITSLISNPNIASPGWNSMLDRLNFYEGCCEVRGWAAETLKDAYERAFKIIYDHIYPDEDMDDGQIPEYVDKIEQLTRDINEAIMKIASLRAQNSVLAAVGPDCTTWIDENGNECGYCDYSPVYAARAQIAANNALIESTTRAKEIAEEAKKEAIIYLNRLKELSVKMNEANNIINDAINQIESKYASEVYHVDTPRLSAISSAASDATPGFAPVTATDTNEIAGAEFASASSEKTETFTSKSYQGAANIKNTLFENSTTSTNANDITENSTNTIVNTNVTNNIDSVNVDTGNVADNKTSSVSETPRRQSNGGTFLGDTLDNIRATTSTSSTTQTQSTNTGATAAAMAASTVGLSALSGAEGTAPNISGSSVVQNVKEKISSLFSSEGKTSNENYAASNADVGNRQETLNAETKEGFIAKSSAAEETTSFRPGDSAEITIDESQKPTVSIEASKNVGSRQEVLKAEAKDSQIQSNNTITSSEEVDTVIVDENAITEKKGLFSGLFKKNENQESNGGTFLAGTAKDIREEIESAPAYSGEGPNKVTADIGDRGKNALNGAEFQTNIQRQEVLKSETKDSFTGHSGKLDEMSSISSSGNNTTSSDYTGHSGKLDEMSSISSSGNNTTSTASSLFTGHSGPIDDITTVNAEGFSGHSGHFEDETIKTSELVQTSNSGSIGTATSNALSSTASTSSTSGTSQVTQSSTNDGYSGGGYSGGGYSGGGSSTISNSPNVSVKPASADSVVTTNIEVSTPATSEVSTPNTSEVITPSISEVVTPTTPQTQTNTVNTETTTTVIPETNVSDTIVTPEEEIEVVLPNNQTENVIPVTPVAPNKPSSNTIHSNTVSHANVTKNVTDTKPVTPTEVVSPEIPTYVANGDSLIPETEVATVTPAVVQNVTPTISYNGTLKDATIKTNNDTLKTVGTVAGVGLALGAAAYGVNQLANKDKNEDDEEKEPDNQNIFKEYIDNDEQLTAFEEN